MKHFYSLIRLFMLSILWYSTLAQAPYCTPFYSSGCASNYGLTAFSLENINQTITCNGSPNTWYNFYGSTTGLTIGGSHLLTVSAGQSSTYVDVWIDFDNNNQFEATEKVINGLVCTYANWVYTTNMMIPAFAPAGNHRMRYRTNQTTPPGYPCETLVYGNSGDFMVNLVPPPPPGNAVISSPANGATGISPYATLNWTPGPGAPPAGYYVYFGTDNPPTNIANGVITSIPFYNPYPDLAIDTTYYWIIVPYNSGGQATAAPVWSFTVVAGYGTLKGIVSDCYGVPVSAASVTASGSSTVITTTNTAGYYQFINLIPGTYTLSGQAASYNTTTLSGIVVTPGDTTSQSITLTQPSMSVLPNPNNVTINPNEELNHPFVITNAGCGMLQWTASIAYNSAHHDWFIMPVMDGMLLSSTNQSVSCIFNANGLPEGTVLNATVTFTSVPDVGPQVVPVGMTVSGDSLVPVTNVQATVTNQLTGNVLLSWDCEPTAGLFYFAVKRDGIQIALVPSAIYFTDDLSTYGTYTYCVQAVYDDGFTTPVCTEVEWPDPSMTWTPAALAATVWSGYTVNVPMVIGNTGLGTLYFEFPDYVDHSGDSPLAYCAATATNCDDYIGNVAFGTINKSSGCNNYSDFTNIFTDLAMGISVPMTVTNGGNPYSSDNVYVWLDYNHSDTFDAAELTQLTTLSGGLSFSGNITVPLAALPGITRMRVRMSYNTAADPCGTQSYGEVEDYSVNILAPTFITAVVPASGFVASSGASVVTLSAFSATGPFVLPGVYHDTLVLHSNDLSHQSVNIPATMTVGLPAYIEGVVSECFGGPLNGVQVSAGSVSTMTNDTGYYSLSCWPGTYTITFSKTGYQTVTITGVVTSGSGVTTVNSQLCEEPYPPLCAYASVDTADTQSTVNWCLPGGPYEMLYDDGSAENYATWQLSGNMNAVKFTPEGYPAKVVGAKLYIGDGTFPPGGVVLGSTFSMAVFSVDAAGKPNTQIGDSVIVSVTNLGWMNISGLNSNITSGDFFIVMKQGGMSPNYAPIGVDETLPTAYKSYSREITSGGNWELSPYQDFMMRAIVSGPVSGDEDKVVSLPARPVPMDGMVSQKAPAAVEGYQGMKAIIIPSGNTDNMNTVNHYQLSRFFQGAITPNPPGSETVLANNITGLTYTEGGTTWTALLQGWYAYGIKAVYPNGQQSEMVYSNAVPHKFFADITFNVQLECGPVPAGGARVKLTGLNYPYDVVEDTVPATGSVTFDNIIKGQYIVSVIYQGYETYTESVSLLSNQSLDVLLSQILYKPQNLNVDNQTLVATWHEPLELLVDEDFEGGVYPPAGWQALTQGIFGWYFSTNGGSAGFQVPQHTTYAISNDDQAGAANDGCCDFLVLLLDFKNRCFCSNGLYLFFGFYA